MPRVLSFLRHSSAPSLAQRQRKQRTGQDRIATARPSIGQLPTPPPPSLLLSLAGLPADLRLVLGTPSSSVLLVHARRDKDQTRPDQTRLPALTSPRIVGVLGFHSCRLFARALQRASRSRAPSARPHKTHGSPAKASLGSRRSASPSSSHRSSHSRPPAFSFPSTLARSTQRPSPVRSTVLILPTHSGPRSVSVTHNC